MAFTYLSTIFLIMGLAFLVVTEGHLDSSQSLRFFLEKTLRAATQTQEAAGKVPQQGGQRGQVGQGGQQGPLSVDDMFSSLLNSSLVFPYGYDEPLGQLTKFSWDTCGKKSNVVTLTQVSVNPDPIPNPGTVKVTVQGTVLLDITAPLEADLVLKKKFGLIWVKVPCKGGKGSCKYADICNMLPKGTCPIKAGPRSLANSFNVPKIPSGGYDVKVDFKHNGVWLACVHAKFSLA